MAKMLGAEVALHLKNMGYTPEQAEAFVGDRVTVDYEEFQEEYTKAFKKADFINAYHYNKGHLTLSEGQIAWEMDEKRKKRKG